MRMYSVLGVSLLILITVSQGGAQHAEYPAPPQSFAPVPPSQAIPAPQGAYPPQGYRAEPQPQPMYQGQQPGAGASTREWPYYPYPPYHNPYYEQSMSPRDALSGTIDWLLALPSIVMDRMGNFLDGRVFPQAPAAQGPRPSAQGSTEAQPIAGTPTVLPEGGTIAPAPR